MSGEVCKRCDGQGWIWDYWVERRIDCEACRRTGMVTKPTRAETPLYVPWGSINVITEPDGHESCNHGDHVECTREGHRTETLYRRAAADLPVPALPEETPQ
jgi:hypothetical protein